MAFRNLLTPLFLLMAMASPARAILIHPYSVASSAHTFLIMLPSEDGERVDLALVEPRAPAIRERMKTSEKEVAMEMATRLRHALTAVGAEPTHPQYRQLVIGVLRQEFRLLGVAPVPLKSSELFVKMSDWIGGALSGLLARQGNAPPFGENRLLSPTILKDPQKRAAAILALNEIVKRYFPSAQGRSR